MVTDSPRLEPVAPVQLSDAQRETYQRFLDGAGDAAYQLLADNGGLRGPFNAFAMVPEITEHVTPLATCLMKNERLRPDLYEAAILTVGGVWRAGYMVNMHILRGTEAGLDRQVIDQLVNPVLDSLAASREVEIVWRFSRELAAERSVTDQSYQDAVALLGQEAVIALVILVGYYGLIGAILSAFQVDETVPAAPASA